MLKLFGVRCLLLFMSAGASTLAQAATAQGTVQQVWIYGNGDAVITGFTFSGASCSVNNGFTLPATNPNFSKLMAVILSAKATGATLQVSAAKTTGCWYPGITPDGDSYVVLLP
jgi:hypothetical protein